MGLEPRKEVTLAATTSSEYQHVLEAMRAFAGELPVQVVTDNPPYGVMRIGVFSDPSGTRFTEELVMFTANSYHHPHIHDNSDARIKIISGNGFAILNGQRIPYKRGDVFEVPRGTSHGFEVGNEATFFLSSQSPGIIQDDGSLDFRLANENR